MKKEYKRAIKKFSWILFILYLIAMAYFLFFSEYLNRGYVGKDYRYNIVLFKEVKRSFWCYHAGMYRYFILNFVMNIVAFIPFGFFLPFLSKNANRRNFIYVVGSALEFTLIIEILQLILKVGTFDVDDIFLNTVGGIIGFILFECSQVIYKSLRKVLRK